MAAKATVRVAFNTRHAKALQEQKPPTAKALDPRRVFLEYVYKLGLAHRVTTVGSINLPKPPAAAVGQSGRRSASALPIRFA